MYHSNSSHGDDRRRDARRDDDEGGKRRSHRRDRHSDSSSSDDESNGKSRIHHRSSKYSSHRKSEDNDVRRKVRSRSRSRSRSRERKRDRHSHGKRRHRKDSSSSSSSTSSSRSTSRSTSSSEEHYRRRKGNEQSNKSSDKPYLYENTRREDERLRESSSNSQDGLSQNRGTEKPSASGVSIKLAPTAPVATKPSLPAPVIPPAVSATPLIQRPSKVAAIFNIDDDDEPEEMPPEARMRMKNIGRETPTSAGPNSFGKTKIGFCNISHITEKKFESSLVGPSKKK